MSPAAGEDLKLYLDIQTTQSADYSRRGIPRYVREHALALMQHEGLVCGLGLNPMLPFPREPDAAIVASGLLGWSTIARFKRAARAGSIAYHVMSPFELNVPAESLLPPFAIRPDVPLVVTLYDLIPALMPERYLFEPKLATRYRTRLDLVRQADLVLTISENTRRDALGMLNLDPRKVVNIGSGVSDYFHPPGPGDSPHAHLKSRLPQITRPFVFSVAGADDRKNVERLIPAYSDLPGKMRSTLQLVITCELNEPYRLRWTRLARECGLGADEMVLTDFVGDPVLRSLLQAAQLFVFPSIYEGFGLPAAEAAACGCPTITSDTSSLPEVLNFPPATFDPQDKDAMAALIERALSDTDFRKQLRDAAAGCAGRHTWAAVADKTVKAYKTISRAAGQTPVISGFRRLRIALAGPFPPVRSGIADYNLRLARELAGLCDLDVLGAEDFDRSLLRHLPGVRAFKVEALGEHLNPFAYDAIVYAFGNSGHHHATYEAAIRYPGVVWFHDLRLAGFYISLGLAKTGRAGVKDFMRGKLKDAYGSRAPAPLVADPSLDMEEYNRLNLGLTTELTRPARGVIVNSEFARRLLELDQGPFSPVPPIRTIPLGAPVLPPLDRRPQPGEPVIGSFGIGADHKAPDVLIDALSLLRSDLAARLVFVGPMDDAFKAALGRRARQAGVGDAVEFTGDVDEMEYWSRLGSVSCAVQIRRGTHGESSAAISDCLSAGVPVVTNVASCAELPAGVVHLIDGEPSAPKLAGGLKVLLADPDLRETYAANGLDYARVNSIRQVAAELVEFVSMVPGPNIQESGIGGDLSRLPG